MRVVSTFIAPSSVLCSLKCKFDDSDTEYLVVAKADTIEVYALQPEGAKIQCTQEIWGAVSSLNAIPNTSNSSNSLLITAEAPDPLAIIFEYVQNEEDDPFLREAYHVSLHLPFSRIMEDFEGAVVHPSGKIAVVGTYVGKLRVLELSKNLRKTEDFDCILTQLNVLSICFLPVSDPNAYVLGILHRDHTDTLRLIAREVNVDVQDLVDGSQFLPEIEITEEYAVALLSVPCAESISGGVLVLGGQKILYYELGTSKRLEKGKGKEKARGKSVRKGTGEASEAISNLEPKAIVDWPMSDLTAYEAVDEQVSRVLLGDKYGRLCLLTLMRSEGDVYMRLDQLGETSSAMTITYLNAGVIFIGSHFGDSQIIRVGVTNDGYESPHLQTLDSFTNIAPVMDTILVDQGPGQSQIITCSGAHNSGSIRIIHSGINFQESAVIENVPYAKSIWPFRASYSSPYDSFMGISFLQSTRFFPLNSSEGTWRESSQEDLAGFSNEYTLALCNMANIVSKSNNEYLYEDSPLVVQVTRRAVLLINMLTGLREAIWDGGSEIIAASVNPSQVAVALKDNELFVLMVDNGDFKQLRSHKFHHRNICSISIRPYDSSLPFSNYIVVGFYESNSVAIVQTVNLGNFVLAPFSAPYLPVSVLLCQFGEDTSGRKKATSYMKNHPTELLVACGDGNVYAYTLAFNEGQASIVDQKTIHLGSTRPAFLFPIQTYLGDVPGQQCILASGSVPMVIYWHRGRLRHSPLILRGITAACSINTPEFSSSVIFAANDELTGNIDTSSNLLIGQVKELRKLHIRKVTFGLDNPVRISHHPELRVLCIGCQRSQPHRVGEYPLESSSFKFIDDTTFEQLYHFPCEDDEEATASQTLTLIVGTRESPEKKSFIVTGTQYYRSGKPEAHEGRIILFEARSSSQPGRIGTLQDVGEGKISLACSTKVKGCVFALAEVAGRLVAAVNESIYVFKVNPIPQQEAMPTNGVGVQLEEVARWSHNYIVGNMVVRGERIYIGDTVNSLSVVEWDNTKERLTNVARDYTALWPVAIETLDDDTILGCDNDCNLFVYRVNATERRLEQAGNYFLGESVNKFVPGTLIGRNDSEIRPEQMFVTSTGRIGVISEFDDKLSLQISALQRNLGHLIHGTSGTKHSRFRSPKNLRGVSDSIGEATGFVDGGFLEKLLEFDSDSPEVVKLLEGNTAAEKLDMTFAEIVRVLERLQAIH